MRQVRHDAHCPDWLELANCRFRELRTAALAEPLRAPGRNSTGGLPTPKVAYSRIGSAVGYSDCRSEYPLPSPAKIVLQNGRLGAPMDQAGDEKR